MSSGRVLVVDDEPQVLRGLSAALSAAGYGVDEAATGAEALRVAALHPPDAVVLDLRLPDISGVEVCRRLREWSQVPVLVVSAVDAEEDKIAALDAGADDYVTKPYAVGELLARLRAVMRRAAAPPGETPAVRFGDVEVDLARREVRRAGEPVHLTPHEYGLLAELSRHAGPGAHPPGPPERGVGAGLRRRDALPARLHGEPAPQAGGGSRPPAPPHHRHRGGLPAAPGSARSGLTRGPAYEARPNRSQRAHPLADRAGEGGPSCR